MGKITQRLSSKDKTPTKLKRRHRRKDLDDIHSRILKTKRKSDNEEEKYKKNRHSKQSPSKKSNKHIRSLHTGIFRNGTKGKNVKKNKNVKKGKLESVVSKARLVGDVLKLFDEESETICISETSTENEFTNQLFNKELVKNNSEGTSHSLENSPMLGKNRSQNWTKCLKNTSKKNKEAEIVFEPIDIPEVIIDQNFGTQRTTERNKKNGKKKEAIHSEHSKTTSYNWNLHNSYMKLCTRVSDEYKNVLDFIEDPLTSARKKLKELSLRTKHEPVQDLSNSKSPTSSVSEHQACTYSKDAQSLTIQLPKNQNINYSSESNQHNKKNLSNFSIDRILSVDSNSWRDERYFDISTIRKNSKLPLKKRFLRTTSYKELPTQVDDEGIITVDCNMPNNILQKYSKEIDRSGSTSEKKFCEVDFANKFQNLPTPSTVNRQFHRSEELESRNKSTKMKYSGRFEDLDTGLYTNVSNKEDKVARFRNCVHSQAPLEVLTAAAAFVEAQHLPQTEVGNLFTDKCVPISSNWRNSFNQQPSPFFCSQDTGPSNFNVEPAKQKHYSTNQNEHRCEKRNIYLNCSNYSHECNISQAHRQNHAETTRTTAISECPYFPIYNNVASNYINLPNNVECTRALPLISSHNPYTYPQQVDDHQHICLQKLAQPVKYFALDNGANIRKIPLYVKDDICQCQNHGHNSILQ